MFPAAPGAEQWWGRRALIPLLQICRCASATGTGLPVCPDFLVAPHPPPSLCIREPAYPRVPSTQVPTLYTPCRAVDRYCGRNPLGAESGDVVNSQNRVESLVCIAACAAIRELWRGFGRASNLQGDHNGYRSGVSSLSCFLSQVFHWGAAVICSSVS
jgi:hypothetical protein